MERMLTVSKQNILAVAVLLVLFLGCTTMLQAAELKTDVVVLGGGAAGLPAALEAADAGADVILLEKMPFMGGSALISGGVLYAAGTSVQEEAGIEDDADALFDYWMNANRWQVEPGLVRLLADQSADTIEWLIDHGVEFPAQLDAYAYVRPGLYVSGADNIERAHCPEGFGAGLMGPLIEEVNQRENIQVFMETPGTSLLEEDGQVQGVTAVNGDGEEMVIHADAVVLATGGFSRDEELMRRYLPEVQALGSRFGVYTSEGHTGDGIHMAKQLGADLAHMDVAGGEPTPSFAPELAYPGAGGPPWLVWVNKHGQRFVDEGALYSRLSWPFEAQEDRLAWAVFDQGMLDTQPLEDEWEDIDQYVQEGIITKADSLEQLAAKLGIDGEGLENTIERYNESAAEGEDPFYLKDPDHLVAMDSPPYYGIQLVRGQLVAGTMGGVRISPQAEVMRENGTTIPGLYAAGEVAGGTIIWYPGGGAAITDSMVMGRIAGQEAAQNSR